MTTQQAAPALLWHLAFFSELPHSARELLRLLAASSSRPANGAGVVATLYSAALLETVSYAKAGDLVDRLLHATASGAPFSAAKQGPAQSWLDALHSTVLHQADELVGPIGEHRTNTLASLLKETQRTYDEVRHARTTAVSTFHNCDGLLVTLADDYLKHVSSSASVAVTRSDEGTAKATPESNRCIALFQLEPLPSSLNRTTADAPAKSTAPQRQQQQHWYAARLYAALTCATSIATPGPLARLLVAYAHAGEGRLQAAVEDTLFAHLHARSNTSEAGAAADPGHNTEESPLNMREGSSSDAVAQARLSGIVAGVLEYALHVAHVRSPATTAALSVYASHSAKPASPREAATFLSCSSKVVQSASQLLLQLTEECAYYQQTSLTKAASVPVPVPPSSLGQMTKNGVDSDSGAVAAAVTSQAVVHAVQELLFSMALGGGTHGMRNRPERTPAATAATMAAVKRPGAAADASSAAAASSAVLVVTTARGLSLSEADAVAQELFPCLVQQLGFEWVWSPLLRHLSTLDKLQPVKESEKAFSSSRTHLPIRWSSHVLLDTIVLGLARKTYPQRLLNILPGSYERLLENLDLLPPTRPPGDDADNLGEKPALPAAVSGLFETPPYYAEPVAAVVSYFQRAGVSGLRVEEVDRILSTAVSTYAMVVRLKAQAAPADADADWDEDVEGDDTHKSIAGKADKSKKQNMKAAHTYVLSRERANHLVSRYQGEVLLAAVIVYTQLRTPSQVQQLMRTLAPLFLKIQLDWRMHHDGSVAAWLLQPHTEAASKAHSVRFSKEATVLMDHVGYEFYPLEWLPALATAANTASSTATGIHSNGSSSNSSLVFPYSLCAAVGHQFQLGLRGTPLGSSGDVTLRHPAGPRAAAVMPSGETTALVITDSNVRGANATKATAAAWRRTERFLTGLMQLCYLDAKTSSAELEGTLAVSSTRRVLTSSSASHSAGNSSSGSAGGAGVVEAGAVAAQRLRALLQRPAVMDAMWGSMEGQTSPTSKGRPQLGWQAGAASFSSGQRREKRPRSDSTIGSATASSSVTEALEALEELRAMRRLLREYGAASFDTTIEAADFPLVVAQSFLPSTVGVASLSTKTPPAGAAAVSGERKSDLLLRAALDWTRAAVGASSAKARINMLLQQQVHQSDAALSVARRGNGLASAYNSGTVDMAWLARAVLREVPRRIWEKMHLHETEDQALARREVLWASRLGDVATTASVDKASTLEAEATAATQQTPRSDPLLLEQWTQWVRVMQYLGLADVPQQREGENDSVEDGLLPSSAALNGAAVKSAEEMSCAQWLWYSPYFANEWM